MILNIHCREIRIVLSLLLSEDGTLTFRRRVRMPLKRVCHVKADGSSRLSLERSTQQKPA